MTLRTISYGGGVQSTALLVLAAEGRIDFPVALFSNVGDDSESPATAAYIRDVAKPYAAEHGIELVEVDAGDWPDGGKRTLLSHLRAYNGCQACGVGPEDECTPSCPSTRNTGGDIPIPAYVQPSNAPVSRSCTRQWKIDPIDRWLRGQGATTGEPAVMAIGISTDELERANGRNSGVSQRVYPLLDLGMSRAACAEVIRRAGLPVPPKSACWFCPFHRSYQWAEKRRDRPAEFEAAVALEDGINEQRSRRGLQPVYLSRGGPLSAVSAAQEQLFWEGPDGCESGVCWT